MGMSEEAQTSVAEAGGHQGKVIGSRSAESVLGEAERFRSHPDFRGTIVDVGGPSANMFRMGCTRANICTRISCIHPEVCPDANLDHGPLMELMEALLRQAEPGPGRRRVRLFVASGIRHDMALDDRDYSTGQLVKIMGKMLYYMLVSKPLRHRLAPAVKYARKFQGLLKGGAFSYFVFSGTKRAA